MADQELPDNIREDIVEPVGQPLIDGVALALQNNNPHDNRLFQGVPYQYQKKLAQNWWNKNNRFTITISPPAHSVDSPNKITDFEILILGIFFRVGIMPDHYWFVQEKDDQGRAHWHGCFTSRMDNVTARLQQLWGGHAFIKMTHKPGKKWIEYCFKDYNLYGIANGIGLLGTAL